METRRLILFVALSTAVLLLYYQLFAPPPPENQDPQKANQQAKKNVPADQQQPDKKKANPAEKKEGDPDKQQPNKPVAPPKVVVKTPRKYPILGSLDPKNKSPLVVYFDSRGAAIRRVELVERDDKGQFKYRNLLKPFGYLGHLALTDQQGGGCRINLVVPGSPAALAQCKDSSVKGGLKVGDRITRINQQVIKNKKDLLPELEKLKAGKSVMIEVQRNPDGTDKLTFTTTLTEHPMELIAPDQRLSPQASANDGKVPSFLLDLETIDDKSTKGLPSLRTNNWETYLPKGTKQPTVEFHFKIDQQTAKAQKLGGPLTVIKRYRLTDKYHLDFEITTQNQTAKPHQISYRLDGPNGLPLEGWWYSNKVHPKMFGAAGARDVIWRAPKTKQKMHGAGAIYKYAQKHQKNPENEFTGENGKSLILDYIGVDTQYFAAIMLNKSNKPFEVKNATTYQVGGSKKLKGKNTRTVNSSFFLVSQPETVAVGKKKTVSYRLFLGPKKTETLKEYDLRTAIEYGWFSAVVKPLSVILHLFHALVGNFGLAILMLTIVVRAAMFPISRKATRGAQMMQFLAPEMKKIAEKYKNDMEKRSRAQRELFGRYNYNPFSGCLLMFFQLPVFIGLYRCLSVDIALRGAPLLAGLPWCANLAAPDMFWHWESIGWPMVTSRGGGWLGPYFNILPIVTITLFIVQQKMFTPPATDDQTRMQQKMMKYMMVFMGILFFKVASGLCLYFIISSAWGIAERKLLPKVGTPEEIAEKAREKVERSGRKRPSNHGNQRPSNGRKKKGKKRR